MFQKRTAFSIFTTIALVFQISIAQAESKYTPENTVFVFDFDGVILTSALGMKSFKRPKLHTVAIIRALRNLGFRIDGGTNNTRDKVRYFQGKYPHIFVDLFTKIKCIDSKFDSKKPNNGYFQDYRRRYADKTKKYYIFIDDNKNNIKTARNNGFIAIRFKDAYQLQRDLQRMEIL